MFISYIYGIYKMAHVYIFLSLLITTITAIDCTNRVGSCYNGPHHTIHGSITSCQIPGTVAMTFDDGASEYTMYIADELYKNNIRATFFTIGEKMNNTGYIMRYLVSRNHQIGSHTYAHKDLTKLTPEEIEEDMMRYEAMFIRKQVLSVPLVPKYMRAPFSRMDDRTFSILRDMGYIVIDFTIDSNDTLSDDVLGTYQRSLGGVNAIDIDNLALSIITIQHDTSRATFNSIKDVLGWFVEMFIMRGTHFVTVADCLDDTEPYKEVYQTTISSCSSMMTASLSMIVAMVLVL